MHRRPLLLAVAVGLASLLIPASAHAALYVSTGDTTINKVSSAGVVSLFATLPAASNPHGLVFDGSGNLYVADGLSEPSRRLPFCVRIICFPPRAAECLELGGTTPGTIGLRGVRHRATRAPMKIGILRELHEARPFMPFTIGLADGRKLNVPHNEFLSFFPSGRSAILTHGDDSFTLIDLLMVTTVDVRPKGNRRAAKK